MFPIAHAWLLERLAPGASPAHYLGCVWPDMLFGSPLTHRQSHQSGAALVALARTLPPGDAREEFARFVVGVLTHGSEPHGFDWYSDEAYGGRPRADRGYAFQQAAPMAGQAARACGVPVDDGWWKAHNLVEIAFEQPLYADNPALGQRLAAACADRTLIGRVADVLALRFGEPVRLLAEAMARFPSVVSFQPASNVVLAEVYARQTQLKHPGAEPDATAIAALIGTAQELIQPTRDEYLRTCVERVGAMLNERMS